MAAILMRLAAEPAVLQHSALSFRGRVGEGVKHVPPPSQMVRDHPRLIALTNYANLGERGMMPRQDITDNNIRLNGGVFTGIEKLFY